MGFLYRALTYASKENTGCWWYIFNLIDCPAILWEDSVFLANKPCTPTLVRESITRGAPDGTVFEGDYAYDIDAKDAEPIGVIVYNNGFKVQKFCDGKQKDVDPAHIYMRRGNMESISRLNQISERAPILFKSNDTIFGLSNFVSVSDNTVLNLIIKRKATKVEFPTIKELVRTGQDGFLFEDDYYNGARISLTEITNNQ